ncbi:hypothetical protein CO049_03765 [Candidatus Roizmanbacteria bacterium CG_4_9_14_0_2_um_filter_36_12]|uniref:Glycosyltransferase RgtA/B/C/D-like domain-containing protein n=1 Tax=Candidatus Roizmanbacteria bacterium CG_4_9_14_0_2_um_filter_36_12 TaxID=1974837 RepID=A0A2M8EYV9_9BACT|nr:MAG: hypothetical protein CO049_03765 [Candidatus Roizmanbacteria bacterium CG_4_9_14_0_2_um_filter_36_12]
MFFILLFAFVAFLFRNAFTIYFLNDDFFFLKITKINSFNQFINFFSPIRQYSYKPVSTEVFYFLIHLLNNNIIIAHLLGFFVYFIGVYYLFKIIFHLSKNKFLSYLTAGFFAINFTHVFQLYYLGTFQEIFLFTFLTISFYKLLTGKNTQAIIFFVLALLSKETAVLFVPFLIIFKFFVNKKIQWRKLLPYIILGLIFIVIYQYSLKYVTRLENYRLNFNLRPTVNNLVWYFLWSLGLPNFMPDYFISILKPPIPEFYKLLKNLPEVKTYFYFFITYFFTLGVSAFYYLIKKIRQIKKVIYIVLFSFISFFIFIGPIGFFHHKWMVRLTIPLIFVIFIQTYFITKFIKQGKFWKILAFILIPLYLYLNILGISIHESSSTFLLESRFTKNAKKIFDKNKNKIIKHQFIYFKDPDDITFNPWGGSKKLKITLGNQNFITHYFPGAKIEAVYEFENKKIPKNSYIVNSIDILLPY